MMGLLLKLAASLVGPVARRIERSVAAHEAEKQIAGNADAQITLAKEHAEALRIKATTKNWSDGYIVVWYTLLATYAALGAFWGGDVDKIHALLRDPGVLALIAGIFGVGRIFR